MTPYAQARALIAANPPLPGHWRHRQTVHLLPEEDAEEVARLLAVPGQPIAGTVTKDAIAVTYRPTGWKRGTQTAHFQFR